MNISVHICFTLATRCAYAPCIHKCICICICIYICVCMYIYIYPPIPYKGCSRGPKLGTYSDWGLSSVLVINKHLPHHVCISIRIYAYIYGCVYVCMCMYMCIYIYMYLYVCVYIYKYVAISHVCAVCFIYRWGMRMGGFN